MLSATDRSVSNCLWLARIREAEFLGGDDLLSLSLVGAHGICLRVTLDMLSQFVFLERIIGDFSDAAELIGKELVVLFDRSGDLAAFLPVTAWDREQAAETLPPTEDLERHRCPDGLIHCSTAVGPCFVHAQ